MADKGTKVEQIYGDNYGHDSYFRAMRDWLSTKKFKNGVEIGFAWSLSARAYLETQKSKLISLDMNDNMGRGHGIKEEFGDQWELILGDGADNLKKLPGKFDYIYIDGDHTYGTVVRDLAAANKKLAKGGYIVCDDYGNPCGVAQAVDEFRKALGYNIEIMKDNPNGGCILTRKN